jgi:hypothetical protein
MPFFLGRSEKSDFAGDGFEENGALHAGIPILELSTEMIEEPEEQAEAKTQEEAGNDGEVEGGVLTAMDDVAGKAAEAERKFRAEEEQATHENECETDEQNGAAEFAKRVHDPSL